MARISRCDPDADSRLTDFEGHHEGRAGIPDFDMEEEGTTDGKPVIHTCIRRLSFPGCFRQHSMRRLIDKPINLARKGNDIHRQIADRLSSPVNTIDYRSNAENLL